MSGHSKWHNIRLRKSAVDAQKGKVFAKMAREIIVAAKEGGGDPETNSRLRLAIQRAKAARMPNDNIERAIQRGSGEIQGEDYEEIVYEGYGPGGVAVMVETMTDNRNRTVADLRSIFTKHGGNLGESGCVAWVFERRGLITVSAESVTEDELLELVVDAGAEDITSVDGVFQVASPPSALAAIRDKLEAASITPQDASIVNQPNTTVPLGENEARQVLRMLNALEEHDDVQNVSANFDIPDELLEQIGNE